MAIALFELLLFACAVGLVPYIALNLAWNLLILLLRGLAPLVHFGQKRTIKWLPEKLYLLGLGAGILTYALALPIVWGTPNWKHKNSGVQANAHNVQMALEKYALKHKGTYPNSLSELFPTYLPGYPRTPWNTQQDESADIPALFASNSALWERIPIGKGAAENPQLVTHFGAIGYARIGENGRHYLLCGTGRKGDDAVIVFSQSSADAPITPTPKPRPPMEEVSDTHISGQVPDPASKR